MELIGIDVGGTFTDLVHTDTERGSTTVHKVPTTPDDPSLGVMEGLRQLIERAAVDGSSVGHVLHGTTVATNAVLEHNGARAGMLTTEGSPSSAGEDFGGIRGGGRRVCHGDSGPR